MMGDDTEREWVELESLNMAAEKLLRESESREMR
jgi:hypothetical protein